MKCSLFFCRYTDHLSIFFLCSAGLNIWSKIVISFTMLIFDTWSRTRLFPSATPLVLYKKNTNLFFHLRAMIIVKPIGQWLVAQWLGKLRSKRSIPHFHKKSRGQHSIVVITLLLYLEWLVLYQWNALTLVPCSIKICTKFNLAAWLKLVKFWFKFWFLNFN